MLRISLIGYVSVNFYYFTMLKLKSADLVCVISIPIGCNVSSRSGHPWQHYRSIRVPTKRKLKLGIGTKRYETKPAFPAQLACQSQADSTHAPHAKNLKNQIVRKVIQANDANQSQTISELQLYIYIIREAAKKSSSTIGQAIKAFPPPPRP